MRRLLTLLLERDHSGWWTIYTKKEGDSSDDVKSYYGSVLTVVVRRILEKFFDKKEKP
jgi:hypothetical protein